MIRSQKLLIMLLALLILGGCGRGSNAAGDDTTPTQELENAVSADKKVMADDPGDADWARKKPPAPAVTDVLLRKTRYDGAGALLGWTDYDCNSQGRVVIETPRNADGSSAATGYTYTSEYEYVNGWLAAKNEKNADGTLLYRYKYDENGNACKWIVYNADGTVRLWYADAFDERGNITVHTLYEPNKEPVVMNGREYDYDEQGGVTECRFVSETGSVLNRYTYRRAYNAAGRLTELEQIDVGASLLVEWYRYEYDAAGRLSVSRQLDGDERCVIRNEYDYDGAGRLTRERVYDSSGVLAVSVEYMWQ